MLQKCNNIDLSVIIPVYNVEEYLHVCIDSLMHQGDLRLEIIMVNDGSTDRSGEIINQYAKKDNRIKVLHQENKGASAARNAGLDLAQGEYIAFVDSDDWVKEGSLLTLYHQATRHQADVVMGNIWLCHQNGSMDKPFRRVSGELLNKTLTGKEGFLKLVKTCYYLPMPFKYLYQRKYLGKIQARFEEGIMYEDELWCPVVLCQAEKMVIVDTEFYYYRQREESVMHTTTLYRRLDSLFRVTEQLFKFAERFDFSGENEELKNWWYVNTFRLYATAFTLLPCVKDSSYIVPKHHLSRFWQDCRQMMPEPQQRCRGYYRVSETGLQKYIEWRTSDWVASIGYQIKTGKKLMLIYNTAGDNHLSLKIEVVPADWIITTDRRYFQQADVVVFYLPELFRELEDDLEKPQKQIWVTWNLESEKDDPWVNDPEIREPFDLWMSYRQEDVQNEHPLLALCRKLNKINIS